MRRLILTIAATLVTLALSAPVVAQPASPIDYCNFLATAAEAVAKDRDQGIPEHALVRQVAQQVDRSRIRDDLLLVIDVVYADPHLPPEQEASGTFEVCWNVYGETA